MVKGKEVLLSVCFCLIAGFSFSQSKLRSLTSLKHQEDLVFQNAVFSPFGNRLISVGNQGMLYLWDVAQTYPVSFKKVHEGVAHACAYSKDGKYIITGGEDKSINVIEVKGLSVIKHINVSSPVRDLAMVGNRLVALLQNSEVLVFDTDTWKTVGKPKYAANDSRIVFNNKGDRFYVWFASRIYEISAKDGELIKLFNTNYASPTDLAISSDDKFLAVGFGQADEIIRIYEAKDMKLVKSVKKSGKGDAAKGLSFFHNSNKLLYQSNATTLALKIYDMESGTNTSVAKSIASDRTSISSDDSKVILAAKFSKTIQVMSVM